MEENKEIKVGLQVITNGIIQAIHHYILAVQIEKKCERVVALKEARALLNKLVNFVDEELGEALNGSKETSSIPKENVKV